MQNKWFKGSISVLQILALGYRIWRNYTFFKRQMHATSSNFNSIEILTVDWYDLLHIKSSNMSAIHKCGPRAQAPLPEKSVVHYSACPAYDEFVSYKGRLYVIRTYNMNTFDCFQLLSDGLHGRFHQAFPNWCTYTDIILISATAKCRVLPRPSDIMIFMSTIRICIKSQEIKASDSN